MVRHAACDSTIGAQRIGLELVNRTDGSGLIARLRFDSAMTVSSEASPDRAPLESEAPIAAPATDPI